MKNVILLTVTALVLAAAIIGLLWVFDVIAQSDAIEYAIRIGVAIIIVACAAMIILGLSRRQGGGTSATT